MNGTVLVAALLVPLIGALVALLVPSGSRRPPRPRFARSEEDLDDSSEGAEAGITLVVADPDPVPDPTVTAHAGTTSRTTVRIAALAAAGLWTAVVLLGGATVGQLSAEGPVGPAGAGAALLLASVSRPARRGLAAGGALALSLVTAGLALAGGSESGTPTLAVLALAGGAGVVALITARENDGGIGAAAMALVGMVAVAGGLVQGSLAGATAIDEPLGAGLFLVVGGTLIATAGALRPRRSTSMLLPVGLAIGVAAGATLGSLGEGVALVLALAAVAVAGGWAAWPDGPGGARLLVVALALVALAVAAVPAGALPGSTLVLEARVSPGVPAAWLLAAAAVVTGVVLVPTAALSAVPGAAAFAVVVAAEPSPARLAVAGLALTAVVVAAFAVARTTAGPDARASDHAGLALDPVMAAIPALGVGTWLLIAPRSWAWVGDTNLVNWPETVALAAAGGLIGVVAAGASGRLAVPRFPRVAAPDPATAAPDAPAARRAALVAGVALGVTLLALVASS